MLIRFQKMVISRKPLEIESSFLVPCADFRIWNSSSVIFVRVVLDFQYGHLPQENVIDIERRLTHLNCFVLFSS